MLLSNKQLEFVREGNRRWNFKGGATRSGKTYLDFRWIIPIRIRERTGLDGLVVILGVTKATIERNVLEPMRTLYGDELVGLINSENKVRLFGQECYALGAEKVSQVSKLRGASIKYAYGDEVADWSQEVFELLKSRLDKEYSCFDGTFNPQYPGHWLKAFLDGDADIFSQTYTIDDNPFLPDSFKENLKKEYAGTVFYDRYILGRWIAAEGVIYRLFADDPKRYIVDELPEDDKPVFCSVGVDFGGNGSATAFNLTGFTAGYKKVITLAEHYKKAIISPAQLEQDFVDFVQEQKARGYKIYTAYCDSAEQTLIQGLRVAALRERLGVEVVNARKGPINDRIRFYCALMGRDRYKIIRDCKHTIGALQAAVWDAKSVTQDRRLDDGKTNIDSLDAMEYAVEPFMADILALR